RPQLRGSVSRLGLGRRRGRPEADGEQGAAPGRVLRTHEAAVRLSRLAHDRQAQPRPGHRPRAPGPVEAIEYVREVDLVEARPVVAHRQRPLTQAHLDGPVVRTPFPRVVEQVRDGAVDAIGVPADDRGLELGLPYDVAGAAAR